MARCFIAVDLSEEAKEEIKKIQNQLPEFSGKKTEPENLHLTLKFLGEIDENITKEVKEQLSKIKLQEFEVSLSEIGVFSPNFVKIIWVHLAGEKLMELQKKIDESLKVLFKEENRFQSHVTIARVKSIKDKQKFLQELNKIKVKEIKFKIDKFLLMKSTLTEKGPIYRNILEFNLQSILKE